MEWKEKERRGCESFEISRDFFCHCWIWMKGAQERLDEMGSLEDFFLAFFFSFLFFLSFCRAFCKHSRDSLVSHGSGGS